MNNQNEINIIDLYSKLYYFLKRRKIIILAFVLIGIIVGVVNNKTSPGIYKLNIFVKSELVHINALYERVFPLTQIDGKIRAGDIAVFFNCDKEKINSITEVVIDTTGISNTLITKIDLKDTSQLSVITSLWMSFFKNDKKLQKQIKNEKENIKEYVKFIDNQIDELNKYQASFLTQSQNNSLASLAGTYEELTTMYDNSLNYHKILKSPDNVEVTWNKNFIIEKKSLLKSIIIWGGAFFILGILFAAWIDIHKAAVGKNK